MSTIPDSVILKCTIKADSYTGALKQFFAAFSYARLPSIEGWSIPAERARKSGSAEQALELVVGAGTAEDAPRDAIFEMGGGILTTIWHDDSDRYGLDVNKTIDAARQHEILEFIAQAAKVCRFLHQHDVLCEAELIRDGGGLNSVPDVPLAHTASHVAVATEQQVREAYDQPKAFWDAGWDAAESHGDQRLLMRGLDILDGPEYLAKILPQQWSMARAAKPGLTQYYAPQVEPEEREIYHSGAPTLDIAGHLAGSNTIEFTCALEPGQRIHGWEIFDLRDLIETGALPDGRQVEQVRVVFLDCAVARQEKRPLLDIGAKVLCYDDAGELIEIRDE